MSKQRVPQWVKILGLVGGGLSAVGVTIASGGTVLVAVLVGLGAVTTGASALYMPAPGSAGKGQAVDSENPK